MANTFTQIHIHVVFTVQSRACVIKPKWKDELYRYITGIVQSQNHKLLAINGMPDHVHMFFGMRPTQSLAELMQAVKGDSSKWINARGLLPCRFAWQEGYGAFSYSRSQVATVIRYIRDQEIHHQNRTFVDEYHEFLRKFHVPFEERYSFMPIGYGDEDCK